MAGRLAGSTLGLLIVVGVAGACGSQHGDDDGSGGGSGASSGASGSGGSPGSAGASSADAGEGDGRAGSGGDTAPTAGRGGGGADPGTAGVGADSGGAGAGGDARGDAGGAASVLISLDLSGLDLSVLAYPRAEGVDSARTRASEIVAGLTSAQKYALLAGSSGQYIGNVPAVGSLPKLGLNDGPAGVGWMSNVTAFPAPIAFAASWDRELVHAWGSAMGAEQRAKGVAIQLGPMINMTRAPAAGRNFEGFGEDPFLAATLVAEDVRGIQENKVVATAKHFVGNEQETDRMTQSSVIDERTLHEIYYLPFEASVSAGVGAVMCSYNKLNGTYACENPTALGDLKGTLGFSGWVMSDWDATHSSVPAATAGLDMEMPGRNYFTSGALGTVAAARIDDMATRIVGSLVRVGVVDDPPTGNAGVNVTSDAHSQVALAGATESITLLKNTGAALPWGADVSSVAVIGSPGERVPYSSGGGSAHVTGNYITSPFDAITARAGVSTSVTYVSGDQGNQADAVTAAAGADAAVVFIAVDSTEGSDRASLNLTTVQNELVSAVAAANPRTIVVLNVPGAVMLPWLDEVSSVVVAWYPGQENGSAIASVLFGDTNPSGKLPVTFPASATALPTPLSGPSVAYTERLGIGGRALDALGVDPLFELGFGLSYTTFGYDGLDLHAGATPGSVVASFDLENTGEVAGTEVSQLYLTFPATAGEPPRVLRGFERVTLDVGQTKRVEIELPARAFTCWNAKAHTRFAPSGSYEIAVGGSSRQLPLTASFEVVGLGPQDW